MHQFLNILDGLFNFFRRFSDLHGLNFLAFFNGFFDLRRFNFHWLLLRGLFGLFLRCPNLLLGAFLWLFLSHLPTSLLGKLFSFFTFFSFLGLSTLSVTPSLNFLGSPHTKQTQQPSRFSNVQALQNQVVLVSSSRFSVTLGSLCLILF